MDPIFRLSNLLVLPFWGLMIFAPRWRWTARILGSPWVSAVPALFYAAMVLPRIGAIWPVVTRPTIGGVAALLGTPEGATIAWVHFLAFDLFVGRWIYLDSRERGLSVLVAGPILFLTLMLGPLGFFGYLALRGLKAPVTRGKGDGSAAGAEQTETAEFRGGANAKAFLYWAWNTSRPLTLTGIAMALTLLGTLAGLLLDPRVVTGAPVWLKPAKFAISTSVYSFTFVWLLGFVRSRQRLARFAANVTVVSLLVEMMIIIGQAARGTTSHFNMTTPLDSVLLGTMAAFIVAVWLMNLLLAVLLLLERLPNRTIAWSLRLGLIVSLVGMGVGFLMVLPTRAQRQNIARGTGPKIVGAHSVGVADGGPGLPIVGWSTVGGDLRVAHFVGLHAMQVLPFFGWLVSRRRGLLARLREKEQIALVWTAGAGYCAVVLLLAWQALRGQSVVQPDGRTMIAAGVVIVTVAAAVARIFWQARRTREPLRTLQAV